MVTLPKVEGSIPSGNFMSILKENFLLVGTNYCLNFILMFYVIPSVPPDFLSVRKQCFFRKEWGCHSWDWTLTYQYFYCIMFFWHIHIKYRPLSMWLASTLSDHVACIVLQCNPSVSEIQNFVFLKRMKLHMKQSVRGSLIFATCVR